MSNTLEETIHELFDATQYSIDPYNKPTFVQEVKSLILSQAHKIGLEAIGGDVSERALAKIDSESRRTFNILNTLRQEQRQRLSKITGIEGSKDQ